MIVLGKLQKSKSFCYHEKERKFLFYGFSLLEVLLVIGIFSLLSFFLIPTGLNFYRSQQLGSVTQEIIFNLRGAQQKSMSVEGGSSFGARFEGSEYVLFRGESYEGRDQGYDERLKLPGLISVGGVYEIVFLKPNGLLKESPPFCSGECLACSELRSPDCQNQKGCSWTRGSCVGSCTACGTFQEADVCQNQVDCSWSQEIKGGDIIIQAGNEIRTININEIGRINLQQK